MGMTSEEFEEYAKSHNILTMTREYYENRLKADLEAILVDLQAEIEELDPMGNEWSDSLDACNELIQQKINVLKGANNE